MRRVFKEPSSFLFPPPSFSPIYFRVAKVTNCCGRERGKGSGKSRREIASQFCRQLLRGRKRDCFLQSWKKKVEKTKSWRERAKSANYFCRHKLLLITAHSLSFSLSYSPFPSDLTNPFSSLPLIFPSLFIQPPGLIRSYLLLLFSFQIENLPHNSSPFSLSFLQRGWEQKICESNDVAALAVQPFPPFLAARSAGQRIYAEFIPSSLFFPNFCRLVRCRIFLNYLTTLVRCSGSYLE